MVDYLRWADGAAPAATPAAAPGAWAASIAAGLRTEVRPGYATRAWQVAPG